MATIYLSSTYDDLQDYRRKVFEALRKPGHHVIAMDDYVATDQRPAAYRQKVHESVMSRFRVFGLNQNTLAWMRMGRKTTGKWSRWETWKSVTGDA